MLDAFLDLLHSRLYNSLNSKQQKGKKSSPSPPAFAELHRNWGHEGNVKTDAQGKQQSDKQEQGRIKLTSPGQCCQLLEKVGIIPSTIYDLV